MKNKNNWRARTKTYWNNWRVWKTVKSSSEKESLVLLKQKSFFEELANERVDEIENISKQIDFNNLIYYFKGENGPKKV